ncbi:MAG: GNAT family N-acetyltransferase [Lactobacillus sp.]|nr:GNAT family N-acetyltransferase [Lactobacillus sp.]MDN6055284.1 GNAT family N-acetyltransferase [Lactococcus lactis]
MIDIATLARANMNWGELGYFIHNQLWRHGYTFEALSAILTFAKEELNFHRIEAHVSLTNIPSQKLFKKFHV